MFLEIILNYYKKIQKKKETEKLTSHQQFSCEGQCGNNTLFLYTYLYPQQQPVQF